MQPSMQRALSMPGILAFAAAAGSIALSAPARADLKLCNTTTSRIGVALGYNDATGVLTLTGHATKAQYEAALESVSYNPFIDLLDLEASLGQREITFRVNDGDANSEANTASRALIDIVVGDLII